MSATTFQSGTRKRQTVAPSMRVETSGFAENFQKACLASIVIIVPLTTAWAKESGLVILFVASAVLLIVGIVRIPGDAGKLEGSFFPVYIAATACLLVGIQIVPLPGYVLSRISPLQERLFDEWGQLNAIISTPRRWTTISLSPHLTKSCLFLSIAYFQTVAGVILFLRQADHVKWLLRLIAVSTVIMAFVGLAQLFLGTEKFLWLFENPMRSARWPAKGTFTNQNHFAGFLALGFGPCLMQIFEDRHSRHSTHQRRSGFGKSRRSDEDSGQINMVWAALTVGVLLAALLSFSRGGLAALLIAIAVSGFAYRSQLSVLSRFMLPAIVFCVLGLLAFGAETLSHRWHLLVTSNSLEEVSAPRIALWESLISASPSFAIAGSGAGTHAEVYPLWMREDFGKRFSHAENGYLQLLIEMGLPGILLLFTALAVVARVVLPAFKKASRPTQKVSLICLAGVLASLFHSLVDFVWYIPGCLVVTISLLLLMFRMSEIEQDGQLLEEDRSSRQFSGATLLFAIAVVGAAVFSVLPQGLADARSEQHWLAFRGIAIEEARPSFNEEIREEQISRMIHSLESCLAEDPDDYRAMSELAVLYLRRFESAQASSSNPMSLGEIRSTVQSVGFESRRAMLQWMVTAFGDGVSDLLRAAIVARRAVSGQPLRASPYLTLHQVAFLMTESTEVESLLMQQVLRVRPHDASIRYATAIADLEAGRKALGFQKLAYAFGKDKKLRTMILEQVADILPAQELVDILNPDPEALTQIFHLYQARGNSDNLPWIAEKFRRDFEDATPEDDANYWSAAASVFKYLGDYNAELSALRKAVLLSPNSYAARRNFALRTAQVGDPHEAITALKGCLIRNPEDAIVKRRLSQLQLDSAQISTGLTN